MTTQTPTAKTTRNPDDLIVIAGAGGFIAGALTRYFHDQGFTNIRAIDKKPLSQGHRKCGSEEENAQFSR